MRRMETEIAVAGAGAGGMAAALAAAQKGKDVVVFDKRERIGGVANGGQGPFAVNTLQQRRLQRIVTEDEAFHAFMDFNHWQSDPALVSAFVRKSADTIRWLTEAGCEFENVIAYIHGGNHTWHCRNEEKGFITDRLYDAASALGTKVYLNTAVERLLMQDGQVEGLIARTAEGEEITVKAKAVVISTGGFGSNPEMVRKYTRFELNKTMNFPEKFLDGDGLRMAWEAGASKGKMFFDSYVGLLPGHLGGPGGSIAELRIFRQPNLLINAKGQRFTDEGAMNNGAFASNMVQHQPGMYVYMILTEEIVSDYLKNGMPFALPTRDPFTGRFEDWPEGFCGKMEEESKSCEDLFIASSIQELAGQMGVDGTVLKNTVEDYNEACRKGLDEKFFKKREYLKPIRGERIYAARLYSGGYAALGGLNINEYAQVLDSGSQAIPGLYAAGNDANTISGDTYMFMMPGLTSGFAYNTGRIAGEEAADYCNRSNVSGH